MIHASFVTGVERVMLSKWVADLIWPGKLRDFGNCQALAVFENGDLIAGMIYHNYEPEAGVIEISGAGTSKRWLTRETLRKMFAYPFEECDCQAVVMRVDPDDAPLRRMLTAYGFELYVIPRLRGRDKDENVFLLTDDAWVSNKFNRKRG
ncbi:GNAT family N-acetyltransferase [Agrobacterium radiobacter]|uniref:GNAT family N-acetyltransferase n=1 Tax=Agrobacterium radiobacter TaxID=362 RepID=UPI0034671E08